MTDLEEQQRQKLVLERQVSASRDEVRRDLDALDHKLDPDNLRREAKERVSEKIADVRAGAEARGRQLATGASESLRSNPIPALLVGGGVGYFLYDSYQRAKARAEPAQVPGYSEESSPRARQPAQGRGQSERALHSVKAAGKSAMESIKKDAHLAKDQVDSASQRVKEYGERKASQTQSLYEQNPLAFAGVCLAAGAGLAFALPSTRQEDRLVGKYRDQLIQRSKLEAGRAREVAERAAGNALEAAEQEAKRRKVSPDDLQSQASRAASGVKSALSSGAGAARESARDDVQRTRPSEQGFPPSAPS